MRSWAEGRPDRRTLLWLIGACGSAFFLVAAATPGTLEAALSLLPGGSTARTVVLEHHRLVFGTLAGLLAVVGFSAPYVFAGIDRLLDHVTSLDRRVFLAGVVIVTVASRLLLIDRMPPIVPNEDTGHYVQLATTILDEGRYIEYGTEGYRAWRPPAFPAALSVAFLLTGRALWSIVALNTLWMIVLLVSAYAFARHLGTERQARSATLLCTFYPTLLAASLVPLTAVQFAALVMLAAYLTFGRGDWVAAGLGGLVLGLATLTRGNGLLLFPLFLVAFPLYHRHRVTANGDRPTETEGLRPGHPRLGRNTLLLALGFMITLAPWTIRNRVVLGDWVPIGTSGGMNMWDGHHPGGIGLVREDYRAPYPPGLSEPELAEYGARKSLEYWWDEPARNLALGAKIVFTILKVDSGALPVFFPDAPPDTDRGRLAQLALLGFFNLIYYGCWLLAVVWLTARVLGKWPRRSRPGILLLLGLSYVLTFVPFFGFQRYKVPMLPFLAAAAGMVLAVLARSETGSEPTATPT